MGAGARSGLDFSVLTDEIQRMSEDVNAQIATIKTRTAGVSIGEMFDMQAKMNKFTQFSELTTNTVAGMNGAISSVLRNLKG